MLLLQDADRFRAVDCSAKPCWQVNLQGGTINFKGNPGTESGEPLRALFTSRSKPNWQT